MKQTKKIEPKYLVLSGIILVLLLNTFIFHIQLPFSIIGQFGQTTSHLTVTDVAVSGIVVTFSLHPDTFGTKGVSDTLSPEAIKKINPDVGLNSNVQFIETNNGKECSYSYSTQTLRSKMSSWIVACSANDPSGTLEGQSPYLYVGCYKVSNPTSNPSSTTCVTPPNGGISCCNPNPLWICSQYGPANQPMDIVNPTPTSYTPNIDVQMKLNDSLIYNVTSMTSYGSSGGFGASSNPCNILTHGVASTYYGSNGVLLTDVINADTISAEQGISCSAPSNGVLKCDAGALPDTTISVSKSILPTNNTVVITQIVNNTVVVNNTVFEQVNNTVYQQVNNTVYQNNTVQNPINIALQNQIDSLNQKNKDSNNLLYIVGGIAIVVGLYVVYLKFIAKE